MVGATTRKSVADLQSALKTEDVIIIPGDLFIRILDDNSKQYDLLAECQQKMVQSQENTASALARIATDLRDKSTDIEIHDGF